MTVNSINKAVNRLVLCVLCFPDNSALEISGRHGTLLFSSFSESHANEVITNTYIHTHTQIYIYTHIHAYIQMQQLYIHMSHYIKWSLCMFPSERNPPPPPRRLFMQGFLGQVVTAPQALGTCFHSLFFTVFPCANDWCYLLKSGMPIPQSNQQSQFLSFSSAFTSANPDSTVQTGKIWLFLEGTLVFHLQSNGNGQFQLLGLWPSPNNCVSPSKIKDRVWAKCLSEGRRFQ